MSQILRYTDRRINAVDHFRKALIIDPLLWSAYDELCILGAADEVCEYFGDSAVNRVHMQYLSEPSSQSFNIGGDDYIVPANRVVTLGNASPRQLKQSHSNNLKEASCHSMGHSTVYSNSSLTLYNTPSPTITQLSGIIPPPLYRNIQPNPNALAGDGPIKLTVNNAIQAPRRKFMDEGKLRKVSGRLFSDSGPRRSTRLSAEASATNSTMQTGGNGTIHSSLKFLSGFSSFSSKGNSGNFRSVTLRKGQSWAPEVLEEDNIAAAPSVSTLPDGGYVQPQVKFSCGECGTLLQNHKWHLRIIEPLEKTCRRLQAFLYV